MNIHDFFLNNYFCNYNGIEVFGDQKEIKHSDFDFLAKISLEQNDIEGLIEKLIQYHGSNYREAVELATQLERFDIAMDIALKNKDYELCQLIYNDESYIIQESLIDSLYEKQLEEEYEWNSSGYEIAKKFGMSDSQLTDFLKDILKNKNIQTFNFNPDKDEESIKRNDEDEQV